MKLLGELILGGTTFYVIAISNLTKPELLTMDKEELYTFNFSHERGKYNNKLQFQFLSQEINYTLSMVN